MYRYLVVDAMVSGTGIRDQYNSNYLDLESLGLSSVLISKLRKWHTKYKEQFYKNYKDKIAIQRLDEEGIEISKIIISELEDCKVSYFSDAELTTHII